jgi:membrane protease YdiL (CAAX protease family)
MHEDAIPSLSPELSAPPPPIPDAAPRPIAPWPHTLALFVILLGAAALGRERTGTFSNALDTIPQWYRYASSVLMTWLLLGAVVAGIYHRGVFFAGALRNRTSTIAHELGLGAAVYLCGLVAMALVGILLLATPLAHKTNSDVVLAMLPHTATEFALWFCVSASAGFCEELIFRGYLMQQLTAWTRRPMLAVVLSAALFGSMHLYEGVAAILPLITLALVYGFVVLQRKGDLRAVIVAHTLHDFLIAFLALLRTWALHHRPHA